MPVALPPKRWLDRGGMSWHPIPSFALRLVEASETMTKIVHWTRVPGLLSLGAAAMLVGCEAPTGMPTEAVGLMGPSTLMAKKTGFTPSTMPACDPNDDGVPVCSVEVNIKHGNSKGPINLRGVRNGQSGGTGSDGKGAELTVSVLGTTAFDLSLADLASLTLGDADDDEVDETHLSKKGSGEFQASVVDLNGDGIRDLLLHFNLSDMVTNGDLDEATTRLCLSGVGGTVMYGYVISGCAGVSVEAGGNSGPGGGIAYVRSDLIPFSDVDQTAVPVWAYQIAPRAYAPDPENPDPNQQLYPVYALGFPGWTTISLGDAQALYQQDEAAGRNVKDFWRWRPATLPLGYSVPCGMPPNLSGYIWFVKQQVLVRADVTIPAGARNVEVAVLVDNDARVYLDGLEVTRGPSASQVGCASYDRVFTVKLRAADLGRGLVHADGSTTHKLAVWAHDWGGQTYLDFRVSADVPVN